MKYEVTIRDTVRVVTIEAEGARYRLSWTETSADGVEVAETHVDDLLRPSAEAFHMLIDDASCDPRFSHKPGSAVVSYCGALIRDRNGNPFGTLCHFDVLRCEPNPSELVFLDEVAPRIFGWIERHVDAP